MVHHAGDLTTIVGRQSNKEFSKRDLQIADQTEMSVKLTIWGSEVSVKFFYSSKFFCFCFFFVFFSLSLSPLPSYNPVYIQFR